MTRIHKSQGRPRFLSPCNFPLKFGSFVGSLLLTIFVLDSHILGPHAHLKLILAQENAALSLRPGLVFPGSPGVCAMRHSANVILQQTISRAEICANYSRVFEGLNVYFGRTKSHFTLFAKCQRMVGPLRMVRRRVDYVMKLVCIQLGVVGAHEQHVEGFGGFRGNWIRGWHFISVFSKGQTGVTILGDNFVQDFLPVSNVRENCWGCWEK